MLRNLNLAPKPKLFDELDQLFVVVGVGGQKEINLLLGINQGGKTFADFDWKRKSENELLSKKK